MKYSLSFVLIIFVQIGFAQVVETVLTNPSVTDGMCTNSAGKVYTTCGGLEGTVVGLYTPSTDTYNPTEISGLVGPTDVEFLNDSTLIITNYDINSISSYNVNSGLLTTLATGLDGPGGLETDDQGYVYVTNWGGAPTYAGSTITRISPSGNSWTYIDSNVLYRPQAITFNHENQLVVHSNDILYKINAADSTLEYWTDLGVGVGNMVFNTSDSCIYGAANGDHMIMKVDTAGNVSVFAGSIQGYEDGDITNAKFQNPLGITFSPDEDTLYIAEAGSAQRLRRIHMSSFSGVNEIHKDQFIQAFPNPLSPGEDLAFKNGIKDVEKIAVYDITGRLQCTYFVSENQLDKVPSNVFRGLNSGKYILRITDTAGNDFHAEFVMQE